MIAPPRWLVELLLILAACAALVLGVEAWSNHCYNAGVTHEATARNKLDQLATLAAERERAALNAKVQAAQNDLNIARADLARIETELSNEQTISSQRAADLLAGRTRERVLVRATCTARAPDPVGQTVRATAADLDPDAPIEADIDAGVASWLEGVRASRNAAIERLGGCIQAYAAVKAAADAMP